MYWLVIRSALVLSKLPSFDQYPPVGLSVGFQTPQNHPSGLTTASNTLQTGTAVSQNPPHCGRSLASLRSEKRHKEMGDARDASITLTHWLNLGYCQFAFPRRAAHNAGRLGADYKQCSHLPLLQVVYSLHWHLIEGSQHQYQRSEENFGWCPIATTSPR